MLRVVDAAATRAGLPFDCLIQALRNAFAAGATTPLRHRHALDEPGSTLLLMPAWDGPRAMGVKIVTVVPTNGARGLNAVSSTYLLCDGLTGQHLAVIDGNELTARRTAAASALAGDFLARQDARRLLIVGSGHVARLLPKAWAAVRPIERVDVWNVRLQGAESLAATLRRDGIEAEVADDLALAVAAADIVSCATLATEPLIRGAWLRPGTHVDLIGGYLPTMREADDATIRRSRIYADTPAAWVEGGDLTQPLASGVIGLADIIGTLEGLCRGTVLGRGMADEITLFKSVGSAIEDLAAARLLFSAAG